MTVEPTEAQVAYDAFAASYDDFNHRYMYERWTGRLLERAKAAGLEGDRLLDVGCGTGLSFVALLAQGWKVTGCDISSLMIDQARAKVGGAAALHVADMRGLPRFGEFDLVWAVNDAINYLHEVAELRAALVGMRRNLAPGGIVVFDVNTLAAYRSFFAEEVVVERGGRRLVWTGSASAGKAPPGSIFEARFDGEGTGVEAHTHRQRHFPEAEVLGAIDTAGLACEEVSGELEGELSSPLEEDRHTKAVYVCRNDRSETSQVSAVPRVL
jgi:SAM-dependent methyltransferase